MTVSPRSSWNKLLDSVVDHGRWHHQPQGAGWRKFRAQFTQRSRPAAPSCSSDASMGPGERRFMGLHSCPASSRRFRHIGAHSAQANYSDLHKLTPARLPMPEGSLQPPGLSAGSPCGMDNGGRLWFTLAPNASAPVEENPHARESDYTPQSLDMG